ncbi:L-aspartate oxidase [Clostridium frigidicarnis]|uniref:L-aspartate oxidase n=1 Tax=Clostridium frigidicarnis TaxID=84698 RepID=A0A1I1B812_9CLOT|nr:L-aspartate oxidase [Clostridium frigidicarnis]SFB46494.1 L-aspartate oxidase [Clostridium frigidicarnis]
MKYDVIIVGTGAAGLYCALRLSRDISVLLITKDKKERSNSHLAQGGISVLKNNEDLNLFIKDTLKAGKFRNNKKSVEILAKESRRVINTLIDYGVDFDKNGQELNYTREGAHSINRIVHHKDTTGKEVIQKLLLNVENRNNIEIMEMATVMDLISKNNKCFGVSVKKNGIIENIFSKVVILATGGVGGLFENSTNERHLTGDGISLALQKGVRTKDLNYIQIHPTTLYSKDKTKKRFLISEAVRGEGAVLLNSKGHRFVNELLPRDIVTESILNEMKRLNDEFVYLKADFLGKDFLRKRFPNIFETCLHEGYDLTKEAIPVLPAQHYLMGGIEVDTFGRTSMECLFATGEVSSTGVHGANRLASNSLLEALVFSNRISSILLDYIRSCSIDEIKYVPRDKLNKSLVINEIKSLSKRHIQSGV